MDSVMTGERPRLDGAEAVGIAAELFGVGAGTARDLGSERDRSFLLLDGEAPVAVLKVSNASEDPEVLDMEAGAALWIAQVDPDLRVAVPRAALHDGAHRARWRDHWVRLYDVLPGRARTAAAELSDAALVGWGETDARLARALRGYFHPRAQRVLPWDVSHALTARSMLADVPDPRTRATLARVLDAFEQRAVPVWPRLRAQVLHADLTLDNVLTDDDNMIIGIVDFGDMSHTTLVADLASVLDSVAVGREPHDLLRAARLVLDGYQRHTPLEDEELQVLGIAWAARSALTIAISSWRVAQGLEEQAFAERFNAECLAVIEALEGIGWDEVARQLGARPQATAPDQSLQQRRAQAFGPAIDPLFYGDAPIEVVSAQGVWITDATGARLLDAYNNVPVVGHAHPRVTTAIARQAARINTHTRYLHPTAIELSERLVATCPPELDTVILVNSGSEANDLAWRMATIVTGRSGGLCTDFAYHGITEAIAALSPEGWLDGRGPDHVERWLPDGDPAQHAQAIQRLQERGHALAATIVDGIVTSDRIDDLDAAYVRQLVAQTQAAGGLYIADEVQAGHGRTGDALWSFARAGVTPDFVTLGKPMGNGHPVAAVITKSSIAAELVGHSALFSTFGGNPVSAAAAMAVLDVIDDERVLERVARSGRALRAALGAIGHPDVLDVRGAGLAIGVELPTEAHAEAARDGMRQRGVLVGTTGRESNILKIRPPLAFDERHVALVAGALAAALQ